MKDCAKKILKKRTFLKIMGCEKSMKLQQKYIYIYIYIYMKYWRIGEIVYSHFLIEN